MKFSLANVKLPSLSGLRKLPIPRFGQLRFPAGLVIRPDAVELLAMHGRKVTSHVRIPLEGNSDEHLTQAIRKAVSSVGPKPIKRLAVSLLNQEILIRFFNLPMIPKPEWETAAQFEARKYIPFKMEDLVWDCWIVPSHPLATRTTFSRPTPERLDVVFSAMPREVFQRFHAVLEAAGVQAALIEPFGLSLARLASPTKPAEANEFVCLVELERKRIHLVITRQGRPYLVRDVHVSHEAATENASSAVDSATQGSPQLLSELSVSMDFFMREYPSARMTKIILCGEELMTESWRQWLAEQLSCEVELGHALLSNVVESEQALSCAAAVGLLRAGMADGRASIDFLRRAAVAPREPSPHPAAGTSVQGLRQILRLCLQPKTLATAAVAACLPLLLAVLLGTHQVSTAQRQLERLRQSHRTVGMGIEGMTKETLTPLQGVASQQLALLKQLIDRRIGVAPKLDALVRALPEGVWIRGLLFEETLDAATGKSQARLSIDGACYLGSGGQEVSAIQTFEEQIKRNATLFQGFGVAQLGQITVQSDTRRQATYRTFQLSCSAASRRL